MMFIKQFANNLSKSWFSSMQFGHELVSSQHKFVNDFIHFKLIIPKFIKTKIVLCKNENKNCGILANGVLSLIRNFRSQCIF